MSALATAPPPALHDPLFRPLSAAELDATRGGADPFMLAAGVFLIGAAIGMLDRILFGGCKCN